MHKDEEEQKNKSARLVFEYWKARPAHSNPSVHIAIFNDKNERLLITMCSFNDSFLFPTESWQLLLAGCCQHPGGLMQPRSARGNRHSGCNKPHVLQRPHMQPAKGQLFPAPHLLGLRNHRSPYPRNGTTRDENQELRRNPPAQCMRFHTIKTYWYLPVTNINIFIYTSVFPW